MWVIFSGIVSITIILLLVVPSVVIGRDIIKRILEHKRELFYSKINQNIRLSTYIFAYCLYLFLAVVVIIDIITDWVGVY